MGIRLLESIVIRTRDFGESDRLVTVYDRFLGKRTGIARGARRIKSPLTGTLQPPHLVRIQAFEKENRDLLHFDRADLIERFDYIRSDFDTLMATLKILTILERYSIEGEPSPAMYDLSVSILRGIESKGHFDALGLAFRLRFLAYSGFYLTLDSCIMCKGKGEGAIAVERGGFICSRCEKHPPIPSETLRLLRGLMVADIDRIARGKPSPLRLKEGFEIMDRALAYFFNKLG